MIQTAEEKINENTRDDVYSTDNDVKSKVSKKNILSASKQSNLK